MLEYIKGLLAEITPTYVVIENNQIGYYINITLNSYSELKKGQECMLYLHEIIREDSRALYGFTNKEERELFRLLITVNGIGANTGRLILSSFNAESLIEAIATGNDNAIKSVKGIGAKTAQRVIIELKDKIGEQSVKISQISGSLNNTLHKDALSALVMLGFSKPNIEKVLSKLLKENSNLSLEETVKLALNYL